MGMLIDSLVEDIGQYTREAIMIAEVDRGDGAGLVVRWTNPAFTALFRYELPEIVGRDPWCMAGPHTGAGLRAGIAARLTEGRHFSFALPLHRKDGTRLWARVLFRPVRDEHIHLRNMADAHGSRPGELHRIRHEDHIARVLNHNRGDHVVSAFVHCRPGNVIAPNIVQCRVAELQIDEL